LDIRGDGLKISENKNFEHNHSIPPYIIYMLV